MKKGKYDLGQKEFYEFEDGHYVFDLKTGKEDENNYPEQIASYAEACSEYDIKGGVLIYSNSTKKKGIEGLKMDIYSKEELKYHFKGFLHQQAVWVKKAPKQPKVFDLPSLIKMN